MNYQLLATSADDGRSWSKPVAVYDSSRQLLGGDTSDGQVWLDPKGKLDLACPATGLGSRRAGHQMPFDDHQKRLNTHLGEDPIFWACTWLAEKLCMGKPGSVRAYVHAAGPGMVGRD